MTARSEDHFSLHAWIDESLRITDDDQGTYILAAVVCDPSCCAPVRQDLSSLLLRGQQRLHWHDESEERRDKMAVKVASVDMAAIVVVGMPVVKAKQERARRLCMEALLPRLDALGVKQVWLESRTSSLNRRDEQMVLALRGKKLITRGLRVEAAYPLEEPMLWLPDIVAGAVGADRGGTRRWLDAMRQLVTQIEIGLR